ncbi:hypothetical protein DEM27_20335 [Metarhizobium album]|uniref:AsmA domain-containing protein n=1 Tax=Metarhizobium album TaxID=2182425 RepID=A0A2U2DMB0_9HYPH|nr:AsmA family protein [Rhizobium album]PWE54454.1 hypothetical protein DEM27_20335 [Rhizobium album]
MLGRILVFLGGVLVVLLFAALLAPLFVDWTDFRKDFEQQASRIIGKKVVVHGAVDARILPFPSVTLHDVRVGQEEDGTPLVKVERFSMDAELAPFLSGEALIFDMRIEEPVARIRLLQDGTLDWMRGSQADIPARSVVLENVHITGGQIDFIDEQSGRTRRISDLNAEMSAKSLAGPWRVEGSAALDGEKGAFSLTSTQPDEIRNAMRLKTRIVPNGRELSVDLDGELKIVDSKPSYQGTFTAASLEKTDNKQAAPAPRLSGQFELTNERMRVPEYRLEIGDTQDPYVVTGEATLDTGKQPEFLLTADGQQIDVNRIGNRGTEGKTGRDAAISAHQRLNTLIGILADIPVPQVPGRASLKLPAIVVGDTTIRDVRLDVRPDGGGWAIDNAVAIFPGRTQVEAKGNLVLRGEPSFTGDMLVASTQPSGLSSWLSGNVDPVIRQLKTAGFSASVSLTPELQRFERLEFVVGQEVMRGRIERQAAAGERPSLSMDLNGNAIDLDVLRALAGIFAGKDADSGFLEHRIAAQMKASKFIAFGVEAENVDTVFTVDDGALSLERLTIGNLSGAALTAIGRAEGALTDYSGTGRMTFQAFDPGPFLAMLQAHLPHHPVIDRLVRNAAWFANADLKLTLAIGGEQGQGLSVKLAGTTNGSRVNLDFKLQDLLSISDGVNLEATLENPVTSILFGQAGFDPLPLEADSNGVVALKIASSGGTTADATVAYTTKQTSFNASGNIDLAAERFLSGQMKMTLESGDIEPYLIMNGIGLPQIGSGLPIKATSDLSVDPAQMTFSNAKIEGGGNMLSGGITFDRQQAVLTASGDVKVTTADLGWMAEAIYGPLLDPVTGDFSSAPLPKLLGGLNANVKLRASSFWPGVFGPVRDFTSNLNFKGDQLVLDDIDGAWSGGKLSGRVLMGNSEGAGFLQTRFDVEDGDTAAIAWTHGGTSVANGRFGLTMTAEATGRSVAEIVHGASGSGELNLADTTVQGLNLGLLQPLMAAADGMQGELGADRILPVVKSLVAGETASLGAVSVPFNLTSGMLRVQNITAANEFARLTADATIDIAAHTLEAAMNIAFTPPVDAPTGTEPGIHLQFSGPLAAPEQAIDVTDVTNFLSMRAFERERRRVERLQSNVLEKQRLRREVALYKFRADERRAARERAAEEERIRSGEELRLRKLAIEREAQRKAEADAKAAAERAEREKAEAELRAAAEKAAQEKAAAEARAAAEKAARDEAAREVQRRSMPVGQEEKVIRGGELVAPDGLNFDALPGMQQQ